MIRKIKVTDDEIVQASLSSLTASRAAAKLKIKYETYKRHAIRLGVFSANPGGKGLQKPKVDGSGKIKLAEILDGLHPSYQTNKLRKRLVSAGIKLEKCEVCGIEEWNGKKISFDLEHIDGNSRNHILSNLMIICPNCHSQTATYRGKNKSGNGGMVDTAGLKPAANKVA